MKKYIPLIILAIGLLVYVFYPKKENVTETLTIPEPIEVRIEGEINMPGLYVVSSDTTLKELIYYALGLTINANVETLDLNSVLEDNETYTIPANILVESDLVNINTASIEKLMSLPGIGAVTAQKIIDYRTINGAFIATEDIMKVNGIGLTTYNEIKDLITIR